MRVCYVKLILFYVVNDLIIQDVHGVNLRRHKLNMRCTRRFSPGICAESVIPVWTFDFFALNCTERLGCWKSTRSNRFQSYTQCVRSCRAFVELYTQTLSEDDGQLKRLRSETGQSVRRGEDVLQSFYKMEEDYQETPSEVWDGPASEVVARDDVIVVSDMMIPDIDYAGVQINNEDCDLVHHVQTTEHILL